SRGAPRMGAVHPDAVSGMPRRSALTTPSLDLTIVIAAPPSLVMKAFFDAGALSAWWQVVHAVTTPRSLGPYAIEWPATDFRDEVLGRLGGVFRGTVIQYEAGVQFLVADAF